MASDLLTLRADLVSLEKLLGSGGAFEWARRVAFVRERLAEPASVHEALDDLLSNFGGMGSLNDFVFCEDNQNIPPGRATEEVNRELNQLLDRIFREASLYGANESDRAAWLSWEATSELPPRIASSFRKGK